jgi:hypothetical protein
MYEMLGVARMDTKYGVLAGRSISGKIKTGPRKVGPAANLG